MIISIVKNKKMREEKKTFNKTKFALDVYNYRVNVVKMTRVDFGKVTNTSRYVINHMETGIHITHIDHIHKLCVMMGTNIYDYY
jgi:hypothetical protein